MEKTRANNFIHFLLILLGLILCIGVAYLTVNAEVLDRAVLLEERHSGYWDYLSPYSDKFDVYRIKNGFEGNTSNRLVITCPEYDWNGMKITTNEDSSMTITGTNESGEELWFEFSVGDFIPDGTYYFTDGGISNDMVFCYSAERLVDEKDIVNATGLITTGTVLIDHSQYNRYIYGLYVNKNAKNMNFTFYPMMCEMENAAYEPCWVENDDSGDFYKRVQIVLDSDEYNSLTSKDWDIFNKNRNALSNYTEISVDEIDNNGNTIEHRIY